MSASSYLAALGLLLIPVGAALKYLVWDFFNMAQTLHSLFSPEIAEAQAVIHEKKFLPPLADIIDSVAARKALVPAASTIQILTELPIDAEVRKAATAQAERIELDRFYQRAVGLCVWVATPWLIAILASVVFFFLYYPTSRLTGEPLKIVLIGTIILFSVLGSITFALFLRARINLVRLIGANRF